MLSVNGPLQLFSSLSLYSLCARHSSLKTLNVYCIVLWITSWLFYFRQKWDKRTVITFAEHHSVMHSQQNKCPHGVAVDCFLVSKHNEHFSAGSCVDSELLSPLFNYNNTAVSNFFFSLIIFVTDTSRFFGGGGGHWRPCFGFLVTSHMGFKANRQP